MFLSEAYLKSKDDLPKHDLFFVVDLTIEFTKWAAFNKWQSPTRSYKETGNEVDLPKAIYLSRPGDSR